MRTAARLCGYECRQADESGAQRRVWMRGSAPQLQRGTARAQPERHGSGERRLREEVDAALAVRLAGGVLAALPQPREPHRGRHLHRTAPGCYPPPPPRAAPILRRVAAAQRCLRAVTTTCIQRCAWPRAVPHSTGYRSCCGGGAAAPWRMTRHATCQVVRGASDTKPRSEGDASYRRRHKLHWMLRLTARPPHPAGAAPTTCFCGCSLSHCAPPVAPQRQWQRQSQAHEAAIDSRRLTYPPL